ncbi:MAG: HD domain-containing protein [Candidatus Dojkabacteria bacterium]|nr:HD domain-containing protein [Candidatus Dojkabacteria bacterium]
MNTTKDHTSDIEQQITAIIDELRSVFSVDARKRVLLAIQLLYTVSADSKRLNGEPTVIHPLMVAQKTAELGMGPDSVCAALLHDLIEDSPDRTAIADEIRNSFGDQVYQMVLSLSRIRNNPAEQSKTTELFAAQQFLIASVTDLRIIIIKLADKLHNLMTLEGLTPDRQTTYINEIRRIYLPIAEYLGLGKLYREIDDMLLMKSDPKEYERIRRYIHEQRHNIETEINDLRKELVDLCDIEHIPAMITGRMKGIASIQRKTHKYRKEGRTGGLGEINDIVAFRILVDTEEACYSAVSLLSTLYDIEGPIDDYIAHPKPNGYRSIHLNIRVNRSIIEIQVTTREYHQHNEYGPASHIAYKAALERFTQPTNEFVWTRDLQNSLSYYKDHPDKPITTTVFDNVVFVLTPELDFLRLPRGATPVDVAYAIHSDIGDQCIGAQVNNRPVTIDTRLKTGDIVQILTNPKKKYASESWLEFAVTEKARSHIRESVRKRIQVK